MFIMKFLKEKMKKLKIAQVSTSLIPVPPENYGGTELVVHNITEGLVRRGHDVTLFAPGDSHTSAKLISTFRESHNLKKMHALFSPLAVNIFWMHSLPGLLHTVSAFEKASEFDIIHNHFHYLGNLFTDFVKTPVVHTYHGDFVSALNSPIEKMYLAKYKNHNWTAISETQKKNCGLELNFLDVIYHGIMIENFAYNDTPDDYFVWLGRVNPRKGLKEAIEVAKITKTKLIIVGFVNPKDEEFFKREIFPQVDNKLIFYHGPVNLTQKVNILKKARCLYYPVVWEEPFGLVMIEAMACGTPVIGYAMGAVPEIIKDQETGFLINYDQNHKRGDWVIKKRAVDGLIEATGKIKSMSDSEYCLLRQRARARVENYFTVEKMVEKYEKIYQTLVQ